MIETLRKLLKLREDIAEIVMDLDKYGYLEQCLEIRQMQKLEQKLFRKLNKWSTE
jgi:hypothetical protein